MILAMFVDDSSNPFVGRQVRGDYFAYNKPLPGRRDRSPGIFEEMAATSPSNLK